MGVTAKPQKHTCPCEWGDKGHCRLHSTGDSQDTEQREASQHQGRGQTGPQEGDGYTNLRLYIKKSIFFNVY